MQYPYPCYLLFLQYALVNVFPSNIFLSRFCVNHVPVNTTQYLYFKVLLSIDETWYLSNFSIY